jgi:hypothetical protein
MARKSTTKEQSHIGLQRLQLIGCIAHGLAPEVRASSGLASALLALYGAKLEEAERDAERRGNSCSDDGGAAYRLQCCHVQDLRGLVAILVTLSATLVTARHIHCRVSPSGLRPRRIHGGGLVRQPGGPVAAVGRTIAQRR